MNRGKQDLRSLLFWVLLSLVTTICIVFPHTGLLPGTGRDLFIDEAIFMDSAASFFEKGWVTIRGSNLAFDAWVTSGIFGSLIPGAATLLSGSYAWGRLFSGLQNALVLGLLSWVLIQTRSPHRIGLLFLAFAFLIPALPATLIYNHGEVLSFTALALGAFLYAERERAIWAGLLFALAIHLKLIALVSLVGGLGLFCGCQLLNRRSLRNVFLPLLKTGATVVLCALIWLAYQYLLAPSAEEYVQSWQHYRNIVITAGSGLSGKTGIGSRWLLFTTLAGGIGAMSALGKWTTAILILAPLGGLLRSLRPVPKMLLLIAGASLAHSLWWLMKSDAAWIRHGYVGLLGGAMWLAWLVSRFLGWRKGLVPQPYALSAACLLLVVALKTLAGWRELGQHTPRCPPDLIHRYCEPEGNPLVYRSWKLPTSAQKTDLPIISK